MTQKAIPQRPRILALMRHNAVPRLRFPFCHTKAAPLLAMLPQTNTIARMISYPAFFHRRRFARDTGNAYQQAMSLDLAEILKLYPKQPYRADIRLFSNGKIIEGIPFPGPFYTKEGKMHGLKAPYAERQLALVGFLHGRAEAPIILQGFAQASGDKNPDHLARAEGYQPDHIELGHRSGHRYIMEEKRQVFYDEAGKAVLAIDFAKREIRVAQDWKLKLGAAITLDDKGIALQKGDLTVQQGVKQISLAKHIHPVSGEKTGTPVPSV